MKVVLNKDIKGIGKRLQIVDVSEGYARNYLIPKKLASVADSKNVSEANSKNEAEKFKKETERQAALKDKEAIEKTFIEFREKQGTGGRLFGSVTEKEVAEALNKKLNLNVNKKKITLNTAIKNTGNYVANIKLYEGIVAKLKVVVVGM